MSLVVALVIALVWLEPPWSWLLVGAAALLEVGETLLLWRWSRRRRPHIGVEALVGARAVVVADGQVKVNGELWRARGDVRVGDEVRIRGVDGLTLDVERS